MATKQQAIDFIKSNFNAEVLGDGSLFKMVFVTEGSRSQIVFAEVLDHAIGFSSPFASKEDMTPKQVLDAGEEWLCGVRVIGDTYYIRNVAPLENLDETEIHDNIALVSYAADGIENKYVGGDNR